MTLKGMKTGAGYKMMALLGTKYCDMPMWQRTLLQSFAVIITQAVQLAIPLAFLILPYLLSSPVAWGKSEIFVAFWCLSELTFYFYLRLRVHGFKIKREYRTLNKNDRLVLLEKTMSHIRDYESTLANWLLGTPKQDGGLKVGYYAEWLVWAFFDVDPKDLTPEETEQADELITMFGNKLGGLVYDPKEKLEYIPSMRPTLDDIPENHKPLIIYLGIGVFKMAGYFAMVKAGFCRHRMSNFRINYWTLDPQDPDPSQLPIFFVHGVGIGLSMYAKMVFTMKRMHPRRKILLLEVPYVSLSPTADIPFMNETLQAIDEILEKHEISCCSWLAHSFGSVIVSWVAKSRPHYVDKLSLADPVCFQLWDSSLASALLYTKPRSFIHHVCQFFVVQDPIVVHAVARSFWWYQNILFPEDMDYPTWIYYSRYDYIIDAPSVYSYLEDRLITHPQPNIQLTMYDITHGAYLFLPEYAEKILSHV